MIKKWNSFFEKNESDQIDNSLVELLSNIKDIKLSIADIIYDSGIILLLQDGRVLEKANNESDWKEYNDSDEFYSETNSSLDEEYLGNKSDELLDFFNSSNSDLNIKEAYFEGDPGFLLKIILKSK